MTVYFNCNALISSQFAGAFSEEREFEIIGHLQQMVHDQVLDEHGFYSKSLTKYDT